jgi:hypothetical protein
VLPTQTGLAIYNASAGHAFVLEHEFAIEGAYPSLGFDSPFISNADATLFVARKLATGGIRWWRRNGDVLTEQTALEETPSTEHFALHADNDRLVAASYNKVSFYRIHASELVLVHEEVIGSVNGYGSVVWIPNTDRLIDIHASTNTTNFREFQFDGTNVSLLRTVNGIEFGSAEQAVYFPLK